MTPPVAETGLRLEDKRFRVKSFGAGSQRQFAELTFFPVHGKTFSIDLTKVRFV